MSNELNDKQLRFSEEYTIDQNGTQAAIRAGYSENTAAQIASELLTLPKVQEYIKIKQTELMNRLDIKKESIIQHLNEILELARRDQDRATALKCLDMLNKMGGFYSHTVHNTIWVEQPLFEKKEIK